MKLACRVSSPVAIAAALAGISACSPSPSPDPGSGASPETTTVACRVDDSVIAAGDVLGIVEPLWWSVDIYDDVGAYEASLSGFTQPQRLVLAVVWYASEVNNGGHDQFFFNSTGIVWPDALAGLEAAGAESFAQILREAAARFGDPPPRDRKQRVRSLDELGIAFDDLDDRFYAEDQRLGLDTMLLEYIRRNRQEFHFSGEVEVPAGR